MRIWITLCISAVLLAALGAAEPNKPVNWEGLPEPFHTESATNRPNVIDRPSGAGLVVPEGFKVEGIHHRRLHAPALHAAGSE